MAVLTIVVTYLLGAPTARAALTCSNLPGLQHLPQSDIVKAGYSLQSDGKGPYVDGKYSTVYTYLVGTIENQILNGNNPSQRALKFDLRNPVPGSGASSLGIVSDKGGVFRAFWQFDRNASYIYSLQEIPIGGLVDSDRVEMRFVIGSTTYLLGMGTWGPGLCDGLGVEAPPLGSTRAQITRTGAATWRVTAAPGSIATLTNISDRYNPVVMGTYYFSLDVSIGPK
jgi:hypothetical protein